jgi:predicted site-specific integrase-resolvase
LIDDLSEEIIKQTKLIPVNLFAFLVGRSEKTIYRWIKEGRVKAVWVEGRYGIPLSEVERITGRKVIIARINKKD